MRGPGRQALRKGKPMWGGKGEKGEVSFSVREERKKKVRAIRGNGTGL